MFDSFIGSGAVNIGPRDLWMVGKDADCQRAQDSTSRISTFDFVFELAPI